MSEWLTSKVDFREVIFLKKQNNPSVSYLSYNNERLNKFKVDHILY